MLAGFKVSKIVVVQSLEACDTETGRILADFLSPLVEEHAPEISIEFRHVNSRLEFHETLRELTASATNGERHILHIECHGSETAGLGFADGSSIPWKSLAELTVELNIAGGFNLLVCVSACFGGHFLGQFTGISAAPAWCLVAPTHTVDPAELMHGFREFYGELLRTSDAGRAIKALRSASLSDGHWFAQLAETWYQTVVLDYVKKHCTNHAALVRAKKLFRQAKRIGRPIRSIGEAQRQLAAVNRTNLLGKYFDQVFCVDDVPQNAERYAHARARVEDELDALCRTGNYAL